MAKIYFHKTVCDSCGNRYDETYPECPKCKAKNSTPDAKKFTHFVPTAFWKQLVYVALGFVGLQILTYLAMAIVLVANHPENANAYLSSGEGLFWTYTIVYPSLFVIMAFVVWGDWKKIWKSFLGWKPYVAGLIGFFALTTFSILYGMASTAILKAAGIDVTSTNANQQNVIDMVKYNWVSCLFVIGLIGPFCEELTYRVGLFGFGSRLGKWAGYVAGTVVFALIHFSFSSLGSAQGAIIELVSLPNYLFSGAALCFLYDKFGFGASYVTHALNNVFSVVQTMMASLSNNG